MQTRNPFIDDLAKVANGAMGALSGVKDEVENRVRDQIGKILDGMDIPRRDEFDAIKAMAAKAREENEELRQQIAELLRDQFAEREPDEMATLAADAETWIIARQRSQPMVVRLRRFWSPREAARSRGL